MAAFITSYSGYILVSFLPPVLWLLFYLQEDRHPEPKRILMLVFFGGIGSAIVAVFSELFLIGTRQTPGLIASLYSGLFSNYLFLFGLIAFVEEYCKYLAVKFLVLHNKDFDEPIDAMIYMMTAAIGFAAIENVFFIVPVFGDSIASGFILTANRFLGANLLHALSSGIVGYFLARAFFSPYRHHFLGLGIVVASLLHAFFNYFIIIRDTFSESVYLLVLLILVMTLMVLIEFEILKKRS
ncbi:MAG: PrsW family glutamic-type intramembrane protease [bacterium]|nr:PrsW family glutamic-type intramembrane protease [bacterium]